MERTKRLAAAIVLSLVAGCASSPQGPAMMPVLVKASTLGDPIAGKTYFLYRDESKPLTVEQNLFERELRPQLASKGLTESASVDSSDFVIVASYGDKTIQSYSVVPTWGVTGQTSRTTSTLSHSGDSVNSVTRSSPTFGVTGFERIPDTATVRLLVIYAYDTKKLRASGALEEQWKIAAAFDSAPWSTVEPPYSVMLRALAPMIGTTLNEVATIEVPQRERMAAPAPAQPEHVLRVLDRKIWGSSRKIYETTTEPPPNSAAIGSGEPGASGQK